MGRKNISNPNNTVEPRLRFNWGFHDGAADAKWSRPYSHKHFDAVYLAGRQAGYVVAQNGEYTVNTKSDDAWKSYQSPEAKQARRMSKFR